MTTRVLHVQRAKGVSGSERHLLSLLPALGAGGVETRMCVLSTGEGQRFVTELEAAGVDVTVRNAGGDLNVKLVPELVADIREFRADIVHTHLLHADIVGQVAAQLAWARGISSVTRHPTSTGASLSQHRARHQPSRTASRRDFGACRAFLRELRLAPERIRVVHYGIDAERWERDAPPRSAAREAFSVAYPARHRHRRPVDRREGSRDPHRSGREGDPRGRDTGCATRGRAGEERESLERLAAAHCPPGRVRFLGFVPDVETFLTVCDIVAFPTDGHGEGFGLTALEAMAAARPVVATRFASLPEVVDDGVTGVLVLPSSVESLRAPSSSWRGILRGERRWEKPGLGERAVVVLERMAAATRAVYDGVGVKWTLVSVDLPAAAILQAVSPKPFDSPWTVIGRSSQGL